MAARGGESATGDNFTSYNAASVSKIRKERNLQFEFESTDY